MSECYICKKRIISRIAQKYNDKCKDCYNIPYLSQIQISMSNKINETTNNFLNTIINTTKYALSSTFEISKNTLYYYLYSNQKLITNNNINKTKINPNLFNDNEDFIILDKNAIELK